VCRLRNVQGGQGDVEMKIQCLFLPTLTVLQTQVSFGFPEHEFNLVANPVILQHFQASHIWVSGKINVGFVHFAILEGVQDDNLAPPFEAANMGQPFVRHQTILPVTLLPPGATNPITIFFDLGF